MTKIYKDLLKIKEPVIIDVQCFLNISDRFRILYPNGKCEFDNYKYGLQVSKSCFRKGSLKKTIEAMIEYDKKFNLTPIKFEGIK